MKTFSTSPFRAAVRAAVRAALAVAGFVSALSLCAPARAAAQGDEIQVYDGGLAPVGTFNLTWHNNYTPSGIKTAAFRGAVTSHQSFNGVPEWALGVTDWFEAGLYMPLYSIDQDLGFRIDGFKLRTLFAVPHADDRKFFYGANFEFSINAKHWDQKRFTSEIRPIMGWHFHPVDFIVNPIVDTNYTGGIKGLEIVPSARLAYNVSSEWAIAAEEYSGLGTVGDMASRHFQSHQLFGVINHAGKAFDLEFGAGVGLTDVSDKFQLKLILSRDLN